jgi:hypothetical protein
MATAFDGVGMGQFGRESQYYGGENPFRTAMKGLKDFTIVSGIEKSGLREFLNDLYKKKEGQGVPPPSAAVAPVIPNAPPVVPMETPIPQAPQPVLQDVMPIEDQANKAFGISSLLTPDPLQPRNSGMDQVAMQMASAPPQPMNLPQYGKQGGGGGGGGVDFATIAKLIMGLG